MWVQSLGQRDPLEEGMATYSNILAWKIPLTEEPGGLQSIWSQRVRHDRSYLAHKQQLADLCWAPVKQFFSAPVYLTFSREKQGSQWQRTRGQAEWCKSLTYFGHEKQCQRMLKLPHNCTHLTASRVMLKIIQARLQKYVNHELPDVQADFRKGRGTRDQIANICWIIVKAREFQKKIYFCFIDYVKASVWITINCGKY